MSKSKERGEDKRGCDPGPPCRVKYEIYGEEMIQKKVKPSGASGRVYVPPDWVDRSVKIIRIE